MKFSLKPRFLSTVLVLCSLLFFTNIQGQTLCTGLSPTSCSDIKIEIVKETSNVTASCPTANYCADANQFHQMVYKVYLKFNGGSTSLPDQFDLSYSYLNVAVKLQGAQFSHIEQVLTQKCFMSGPGQNWQTLLDFSQPSTVSLFLDNNNSTSCTGNGGENRIHFTKWALNTPPLVNPCQNCAYAELFTVVVNAYTGESISVSSTSESQFVYFDNMPEDNVPPVQCQPMSVETTGTNNGMISTTILTANASTGTINDNLLLEIGSPVPGNGTNAPQTFNIQLHNYGTQAVEVKYLEFLTQVTTSYPNANVTFSGSSIPAIVAANGLDRILHFIKDFTLNPTTISANGVINIGTITIPPPVLQIQSWSATVSLTGFNEGGVSKSRIQTASACTQLPLSTSATVNIIGLAFCSPSDIKFSVLCNGSNICETGAIARVGLFATDPPAQISVNQYQFDLKFDLTGDMQITSADLPSSLNCPPAFPCYTISPDGSEISFSYSGNFQFTDQDPFIITVHFNPGMGCINDMVVTGVSLIRNTSAACIPTIDLSNLGLPICASMITGNIATELNKDVEDVQVTLLANSNSCTGTPCPSQTQSSSNSGDYGYCACSVCNSFTVTPVLDVNHINGVSTFDLVLISKHLLGLEPLSSPYQMIAADANKSNSITTFDIVELRKLILGVYTVLPNNTSWRFVSKSFIFPNPSNPFQSGTIIPENIITTPGSSNNDFVGIKIGDINGNAIANSRPAARKTLPIEVEAAQAKNAGAIITLPVRYAGSPALEGIQLGLRFDPDQLELIGPASGDLPYLDEGSFNFSEAAQGHIKALWVLLDEETRIAPGAVLFYLNFRVKTPLPESGAALLQLDDNLIANAAWGDDHSEYALGIEQATEARTNTEPVEAALSASCRPNPGTSDLYFVLQSRISGKGRMALFDAYGRRLLYQETIFSPGEQEIPFAPAATLPPGVYRWKIWSGKEKAQGIWIKQ